MPEDQDEKLAQIRKDLAYFTKAQATMGGGQPPTLYAEKYVEDVEFLLKFISNTKPQQETPKTDVEVALEHDTAGRVERKPKRG